MSRQRLTTSRKIKTAQDAEPTPTALNVEPVEMSDTTKATLTVQYTVTVPLDDARALEEAIVNEGDTQCMMETFGIGWESPVNVDVSFDKELPPLDEVIEVTQEDEPRERIEEKCAKCRHHTVIMWAHVCVNTKFPRPLKIETCRDDERLCGPSGAWYEGK